jgi:hypothetical protein
VIMKSDNTLLRQLKAAIDNWEDERWDFKSGATIEKCFIEDKKAKQLAKIDLCEDIAAFANLKGGKIVIGIEDEKKGKKVTGFKITDSQKDGLANTIRSNIIPAPTITFEIIKYSSHNLTLIKIDKVKRWPATVNHIVYMRGPSGKYPLTGTDIANHFIKRNRTKAISFIKSKYNLPTVEERRRAIKRDLQKESKKYGFVTQHNFSDSRYIANRLYNNKNTYYEICVFDRSINKDSYLWLFYMLYNGKYIISHGEYNGPKKKWFKLHKQELNLICLSMGKTTSNLEDAFRIWGLSMIKTRFGFRVENREQFPALRDYPFINCYFLDQIIDSNVLHKKFLDLMKWIDK